MRRFTLITLIVLFALIAVGAILQVTVGKPKPGTSPGPIIIPTASP